MVFTHFPWILLIGTYTHTFHPSFSFTITSLLLGGHKYKTNKRAQLDLDVHCFQQYDGGLYNAAKLGEHEQINTLLFL